MNFTTPKLCSLLHQILDVLVVQDIAWDVDGLAAALVDLIGYRLALLYATQSVPASIPLASSLLPLLLLLLPFPHHHALMYPVSHLLPSISDTTTLAPSFANSLAASAPMPCPEPVMMAVWPANMPLG